MIDLIVNEPKYTVEKLERGDYLVSSKDMMFGSFDSVRDLRKYMNVVVDDFEKQLAYGNMERNFKVVAQ
jgi:hypothetical protein